MCIQYMRELFENMYLNIVVTVMYFVARVLLSLLIYDFSCTQLL